MGLAKRLALLALPSFLVAAVAAAPAQATYHLLRINEVFPSATTSQQPCCSSMERSRVW